MSIDNEAVMSAATSCLLYISQSKASPTARNGLIRDWLRSAERRRTHSSQSIRIIKRHLKHATKSQVTDLASIIHLLVEGRGSIPDATGSRLYMLKTFSDHLGRLGWRVVIGNQNDWDKLDVHYPNTCFGLKRDVECCFGSEGEQIQPLPLYVIGDVTSFRQIAGEYDYLVMGDKSEFVDGVSVHILQLTSDQITGD